MPLPAVTSWLPGPAVMPPETITTHGSEAHGAAIRRDDEEHCTLIEARHVCDFNTRVKHDYRSSHASFTPCSG